MLVFHISKNESITRCLEIIHLMLECLSYSLHGSVVKNLPAMQETQEMWVRSLGRDDPLEEEMANHSCIPCLKNPMDRGAWWPTVQRVAKSQTY